MKNKVKPLETMEEVISEMYDELPPMREKLNGPASGSEDYTDYMLRMMTSLRDRLDYVINSEDSELIYREFVDIPNIIEKNWNVQGYSELEKNMNPTMDPKREAYQRSKMREYLDQYYHGLPPSPFGQPQS